MPSGIKWYKVVYVSVSWYKMAVLKKGANLCSEADLNIPLI